MDENWMNDKAHFGISVLATRMASLGLSAALEYPILSRYPTWSTKWGRQFTRNNRKNIQIWRRYQEGGTAGQVLDNLCATKTEKSPARR